MRRLLLVILLLSCCGVLSSDAQSRLVTQPTPLRNAAADGATKGVVTFPAAEFNCTAGLCSFDYTNAQAASGSLKGFLTSADWTTFNAKQATITAGAGLLLTGATLSTASSETDFLASGALACGAGTQGKMQVHTTPLQYCGNEATPTLQYAAYGDSAGKATSAVVADTATALAANGANCVAGAFPRGIDASGVVETCSFLPTSITGTANQITASDATGAITLSIPTNPTLPGTTTGTFSGNLTGNITGNAATVTTNANLTGHVTSTGNATLLGAFTAAQLNTAVSDADVATLTGTETLTAKRITKRVTTLSTSSTYTCPGDTSDQCEMQMTGGAGTLTVAAPTGTPVNGDMLMLGFLCTNAQTFAWNAIFVASPNVALPTTCPAGVTMWTQVGVRYSTVLTKYQVLATN